MKTKLLTTVLAILTTAIFSQTFTDSNNFTYQVTATNPNTVKLTSGNDATGAIIIPSTVAFNGQDYTVTVLGSNAFSADDLESVVIPNSIIALEGNVFRGSNLPSITIPDSVVSIGNFCFLSGQLTSLVLGTGLETIGTEAFRNCPLETVTSNSLIPAVLSTFSNPFGSGDSFFTNKELIIPSGSEDAYRAADWFEDFALVNGNLVQGNDIIVDGFTYEITSANTVQITDGDNSGDITIPSIVNFKDFDLSVTGIGSSAFREKQITSVVIPEGVENINRDAFFINNLVEVTIPSSVKSIGQGAFSRNTITSITIPEGVTSIGLGAFRFNNLRTAIISASVSSIDNGAFRDNTDLEVVTSLNPVPPTLGTNVFNNTPSLESIIVPVGTIDAYTTAGWPQALLVEASDSVQLNLKVFLQGAYINTADDGLMRDDLRKAILFPNNSPYNDARPINDTLAFIDAGEKAMVDWVFVELRDADNPTTIIDSRSLILQRDGTIIDFINFSNGAYINVGFDRPEVDDYLIVIRHRNHISIQTANPISSLLQNVTLDFTSDSTLVEGGENAQTEVSDGIFAIIAGDFDENGQVQPSDVNETTAAIGTSDYSNADMDMNGQIQPADVNNLVNPNVGRGIQF